MGVKLLPWKLTTTAALIAPLIILFLVKKWKKSNPVAVNLPPGPKKLPIIGNLHLISQPSFRCFRDLAKQYGPIMHLKLGEVDTIVAKEVLKDNDPVFTNRPESIALKILWYNYTGIAFCPYGDYWRQMRKICATEMLSARNVRSFAGIRKDEVSRLVEFIHLSAGIHPVNLTEKVSALMSSIVCRTAYGKEIKNKELLARLVTQGLEMGAGFSIADVFPSSKIANKRRLMRMRKLDLILDHESNRNTNSNEDLVDVLFKFPITYHNITNPSGFRVRRPRTLQAVILDTCHSGVGKECALG